MKTISHTITDPLGIHARPAGLIAKLAKEYPDTFVTITKGETAAKATQLMKLMSLGVKQGDTITLTCDGPSEEAAIEAIGKFLTENL